MNRKGNCAIKVLLVLGFASTIQSTPTTITAPPVTENVVSHDKDDLRHYFGHCLHKKDVGKCLKNRMIDVMDDVITSNDPLSLKLFNLKMSLNKNPQFQGQNKATDTGRSFEDVVSQKLRSLLESRLISVKVADDTEDSADAGQQNEARKKKGDNKHGHSMMMSGMALMAFLAQMFLSKVAFMSGAALLLAKIALLFSALSSLKKSSSSGGSEHVVYSADVGKQGWQRSIHTMSPVLSQQQPQNGEELPYRGQPTMPSYDGV